MDLDLVVRGATVIDGTGAPGKRASVGIASGKIAAIDEREKLAAPRTIDAGGLVLAPGFIDTHSHSDLRLLVEPDLPMKVRQGVTLEVLGQDGISVAPLVRSREEEEKRKLAGLLGRPDVAWTWTSMGDYLQALERAGPSPNVASLVPHGAVRTCVVGPDDREATAAELVSMQDLLDRSLREGAIGISTGLIYPPCCYAKTDELVALARTVAKREGPFVVHMRSESDHILEAIDEMVGVGRASGCRIHISHWKIAGKENFSRWKEVQARVEEAQRSGVTVTCDQYPYAAGSTVLSAILPPWVHSGGPEAAVARLGQAKMREQMTDPLPSEWDNFWRWTGPEGIVVSDVPSGRRPELIGKSIADGARAKKADPLDFALDLLRDETLGAGMVSHNQSLEVMRAFSVLPYVNVCTDALLGGRPHPRAYGTYPRILGRHVRDEKLLSLEEAIRKMTSQAALAMNLRGVGRIAPGFRADLVVFSKEKIIDCATYEEPARDPEGIVHVLVNGKPVLADGKPLGRVRAGEVVRGRG
ncbi:D-aminoacylase [bacterium]|nr:D-aminoacylase [bacterium]